GRDLVAHVDARGGVVAHQHGDQLGGRPGPLAHLPHTLRDLAADRLGHRLAVEPPRPHARQPPMTCLWKVRETVSVSEPMCRNENSSRISFHFGGSGPKTRRRDSRRPVWIVTLLSKIRGAMRRIVASGSSA